MRKLFFLFFLIVFLCGLVSASPILEQTTSITATVNSNGNNNNGNNGGGGGGGGGGSGFVTQCNDDEDNDEDGFCDYAGCYVNGVWLSPDVDCEASNDLNESIKRNVTIPVVPVITPPAVTTFVPSPNVSENVTITEEPVVVEPEIEPIVLEKPVEEVEKNTKSFWVQLILGIILVIEIIVLIAIPD